jgi:hypothetical protein
LRFVIKPRSLADLMYPIEGVSDDAEQLAGELKNKQDDARDAIAVAQRKQKRLYDSKRKNKEFEVGDLVVLKFNRFGPGYKPLKPHDNKLGPLGTPLRITEKLSPISYRLALPSNSRIHDVVSIIHLRRYNGVGRDVQPLPIQVDGAEEYEVERIDGQRINSQGMVEFLVKWVGYGDKERTWEPISNLTHADAAIAEWNASRNDAKPKPKKTRHPRQPAPENTIGRRTRSHTRSPSPHPPSPHAPTNERSSNMQTRANPGLGATATATAPQPRRSARIKAQSSNMPAPASSNNDPAKGSTSRAARDRQHLITSSQQKTAASASAKKAAAAAAEQKAATAAEKTATAQEDAATQEANTG